MPPRSWRPREGAGIRRVSFAELLDQVERAAGAFAALGVGSGDAVGCYLPMSVEAVVTLLASARIGAIFIPIFSGYGAEAVAARLIDPSPALLVTADGYLRRGRLVEMKETADEALVSAGGSRLEGYPPCSWSPTPTGRTRR